MKTVRVRIAVAVDHHGCWCAAGWRTDLQATTDDRDVMAQAIDMVEQGEARYWIEVELPLPVHPVITDVLVTEEKL